MKKPYPPYPPRYTRVDTLGTYARTCVVVEVLSVGRLSPAQMALVQDQLEATAAKLKQICAVVEQTRVITPDQFDPLLCDGLRLTRTPDVASDS